MDLRRPSNGTGVNMAKADDETPLYQEIDSEPYAKVIMGGEERKDFHTKGVWHFEIDKFMAPVVPANYFKTTGEAIQKLNKLKLDLLQQVAMAERLKVTLTKLRGSNVYLETQWNDGKLLLKVKNPRKAKPDQAEATED
jgi:hypothetical protein